MGHGMGQSTPAGPAISPTRGSLGHPANIAAAFSAAWGIRGSVTGMGVVRAAVAAVALALWLSACGGDSSTDRDRQQIIGMVERGHDALLQNRPQDVCKLLTARARRNSLHHGTEYTGSGARRLPRTCQQAIGDQIGFAQMTRTGLTGLGSHDPRVSFTHISRRSAQVRVEPPGVDIYFVRGMGGWRADRTNDFPFDGGTGE